LTQSISNTSSSVHSNKDNDIKINSSNDVNNSSSSSSNNLIIQPCPQIHIIRHASITNMQHRPCPPDGFGNLFLQAYDPRDITQYTVYVYNYPGLIPCLKIPNLLDITTIGALLLYTV
jgi:hypothetical protein